MIDNEFKYNIGDVVSYYNISNFEDINVTVTDMYVSRSTGVQRYVLVDNSGYMYNSDESNIKPIPTKFKHGQTVRDKYSTNSNHRIGIVDSIISPGSRPVYYKVRFPDNYFLGIEENQLTDDLEEQSVKDQEDVTEKLIFHIRTRQTKGILTYGRSLETFNGRDALKDALDEALDMAQYIMQAILERNSQNELIKNLTKRVVELGEENKKLKLAEDDQEKKW